MGLTSENYRQVKIIGLHEDVGYLGAKCKDVNLYSRVLLVEDIYTKQQFIVSRPKDLWVATPHDQLGNFVMNHEVIIDLNSCDIKDSPLPTQISKTHKCGDSINVKDASLTGTEQEIIIDTGSDPLCADGILQIKFQSINIPDWIRVVYSNNDTSILNPETTTTPAGNTTTPDPTKADIDLDLEVILNMGLSNEIRQNAGEKTIVIGESDLITECAADANSNFPAAATPFDFHEDSSCEPWESGCNCPVILTKIGDNIPGDTGGGTSKRRYIKIIINEGDNFCKMDAGGTAWKLNATLVLDPFDSDYISTFCDSQHNFENGEPVEHWFLGNKTGTPPLVVGTK